MTASRRGRIAAGEAVQKAEESGSQQESLNSKQKRQDISRRVWTVNRRGRIAAGESEQQAEEAG